MISLERVTKAFDGKPVLKEISFTVSPGEIVGFVGSNGSGKTTTMRSIMGLIHVDQGTIQIEDKYHQRNSELLRLLGYMPEERGLYANQSVRSQLNFFGELQGLEKNFRRNRIESLLNSFGIEKYLDRNLGDLSLGNQQRVQMAVALIHKPRYLILDEPFSGLDPMGIEALLNVLREQAREGTGILFSSHILPFVQEISHRILILSNGNVQEYSQTQGELSIFYKKLVNSHA